MPYNNTAIPPSEEVSGQSVLPLTRIKKIIRLDEDIAQCSNNAAFLISIATEMFVRYLAEQGLTVIKSERKPRKNIQYRDIATAVSRIDSLEFLADVIPKTTTYRQFKEKRAKETAKEDKVPRGQRTLPEMEGVEQNGATGESREEFMVNLNGESSGAQVSSPRPPMVIHSSQPRRSLTEDKPTQQQDKDDDDTEDDNDGDEDVKMTS